MEATFLLVGMWGVAGDGAEGAARPLRVPPAGASAPAPAIELVQGIWGWVACWLVGKYRALASFCFFCPADKKDNKKQGRTLPFPK